MNFKYLIVVFFILLVSSCKERDKQVQQKDFSMEDYKKPLEVANKLMVKTEDAEIDDFIKRYGWKTIKTSTGLRYMIYKEGKGEKPIFGNRVEISYEISLITGAKIYSSKEEGTKKFQIGKSSEVRGLDEAVQLMRINEKAKLIIPSHLAYGLHGDENKIPKRATLVYDVELLKIMNNE